MYRNTSTNSSVSGKNGWIEVDSPISTPPETREINFIDVVIKLITWIGLGTIIFLFVRFILGG